MLQFASLTGDSNPIHVDLNYARKSRFKNRIAHGMLTASFISTALATIFPGPGTIYLRQNLIFRAPVYIGDTITIRVEALTVDNQNRATFKTQVFNQDDRLVVDGEAMVLLPEKNVE